VATAGQVALVSSRLTTNQAICALIPKQRFTFFNFLWMSMVSSELKNKAVGSAQQNISKKIVEETSMALPPLQVLEKFGLVNPLFDNWILNLRQSHTLASIRDTLLPKLISGELRIPNVEKIVRRCI
jgi:type I restriction enzyme S subunit